jgi:hypothetical protein
VFTDSKGVNVITGSPSRMAILVDNTNQSDATWTPYTSSNITVNLGTTAGWHEVYVGLRGLPTNAFSTWQSTRLNLDSSSPLIGITNPAATRPIIQIQGYSSKSISSISYDITNSSGLITNQPIISQGQFYDTNTLDLTTNYFQCFDVALTNGANLITIHATDLAGNTTTTNFTYTYSSPTNPPTVQLYWPQQGTKISGGGFTWRGKVSDPTARVIAQTTSSFGYTNSFIGQVDRTGNFWISDLPLSSGTNPFSLLVKDTGGNVATTNINVIQSTLILTITSASLGNSVSGTISDWTNYTIWVNGTKATNNGDGTWIAPDPHLTLSTQNVQVRAIPNSDNGGNGGGL